jgi:hypothetical protein
MKPNLSLFERIVRPALGCVVALVALSQPEIGLMEMVALVAAVFLILNGLLARCYLWQLLGINTARNDIKLCSRSIRQRD